MKTQLQAIGDEKGVVIPKDFLAECGLTDSVNLRLESGRIIIEAIKSKPKDRPENFCVFVMAFCQNENKAALAALKGADNPQKQQKSFHYLAPFYIDVDNQEEWLPYATIAAAIAKADVTSNGNAGIARVIARCYGTSGTDANKEIDSQAVSKLRRLLACDNTEEVCRVLRPLFSLINAKGLASTIDYSALLRNLTTFHFDNSREKTRQKWARDFYGRLRDKDDNDE